MGWLLSNHPISHIRVKGIVMQNLFLTIDRISTFVGHLFAWLVVGLTGLIGYEVFSRYVLNNPHAWAFDAQIMLYGTMFMMAGAYTLAKNGHVRGDICMAFWSPVPRPYLILFCILFSSSQVWLLWHMLGIVLPPILGEFWSTPPLLLMALLCIRLKPSFQLLGYFCSFRV